MKLRRSMLFIPGNNPGVIKDVHIYRPDSIMFDLEDAIAITEKDSARILTYNMIKKMSPLYKKLGIETVVRINALDTEFGVDDIEAMVKAGVDVIRIPKTDLPEHVTEVEGHVERFEKEAGIPVGTTKLMVAIEGPLGALKAYDIATSSDRLVGMAIGGEDFVTNLKTSKSDDGLELFTARGLIVMAARAAGIDALDSVFANINNPEGFENEAKMIKKLGFSGKSLIHPSQIELLHKVYTPTEAEIKKSIKIVEATREALEKGLGVFTVDGKMVDGPIITRAQHVLTLAKAAGIKVGGDE